MYYDKEKWCDLLNEANIGDIITHNGMSVEVLQYDGKESQCLMCAFYKNNDCSLYCDLATPCSPFNNVLGKPLVFNLIEQ